MNPLVSLFHLRASGRGLGSLGQVLFYEKLTETHPPCVSLSWGLQEEPRSEQMEGRAVSVLAFIIFASWLLPDARR